MEDVLLGYSSKGAVVDAVMMVEMFVLGVDEGFPEHGVHLFVSDGCAVLAEELAYQFAVGAVDHRGSSRAFVLDGRHGRRLAEEPEEVDVDGSEVEEECHYQRGDGRQRLDIPGAPLVEALIPSPYTFENFHDLLIFSLLLDITDDFFFVVGMEPADLLVFLIPRQLFAGIAAGVALDALYSLVERPLAFHVFEHLLVSHGVEGIQLSLRIHLLRLFKQSFLHHLVHTAVDALVEFFAGACESYLNDAEGAGFLLLFAEGGVGLACHHTDLEGMHHATGILLVDNLVVFRVALAELFAEASESFHQQALLQRVARLVVDGRNVVDAIADGVDIHHAAT